MTGQPPSSRGVTFGNGDRSERDLSFFVLFRYLLTLQRHCFIYPVFCLEGKQVDLIQEVSPMKKSIFDRCRMAVPT